MYLVRLMGKSLLLLIKTPLKAEKETLILVPSIRVLPNRHSWTRRNLKKEKRKKEPYLIVSSNIRK